MSLLQVRVFSFPTNRISKTDTSHSLREDVLHGDYGEAETTSPYNGQISA